MTDSTISSDSFCGGSPQLSSVSNRNASKSGSRNSVPETLIGKPPEGNAGAVPFGGLGDRLVDDDAADLRPSGRDFSATGMNSPGEIMPRCGMVPAHQRLDAGDGAVGQRDLRLEIDAESPLGDGDLEVVLELLAVLELLPQLLGEEREAAAAELLGRIERKVGMDDQILGVVGVDRIDGDAGAGARKDGGARGN